MAVQPVGRRGSVKWPTLSPGTSVSDPEEPAAAAGCACPTRAAATRPPPSAAVNSRRLMSSPPPAGDLAGRRLDGHVGLHPDYAGSSGRAPAAVTRLRARGLPAPRAQARIAGRRLHGDDTECPHPGGLAHR